LARPISRRGVHARQPPRAGFHVRSCAIAEGDRQLHAGFRGQSTAGVGAANYAAAATGGRSGSPGTGAPITDTGEDLLVPLLGWLARIAPWST
jgi:hypothetical protein